MTTPAEPGIVVRRALPTDADAIASVHVRAWRETYRHLVPGEKLDTLDPADRAERWRGILAGVDEDAWVAVRGDSVIGWATTSPRNPATQPRDLELNGLYLLARDQGSGAGQALLDAALGDRAAFLWVAADNPRAHAFYRRNGFAADGAREEYPLLGTPVTVVRLVR